MAKNKKAAASSASYSKKKAVETKSKKPVKKASAKYDSKKIEVISTKLAKMNKNFENLIQECKTALQNLTYANSEL